MDVENSSSRWGNGGPITPLVHTGVMLKPQNVNCSHETALSAKFFQAARPLTGPGI